MTNFDEFKDALQIFLSNYVMAHDITPEALLEFIEQNIDFISEYFEN